MYVWRWIRRSDPTIDAWRPSAVPTQTLQVLKPDGHTARLMLEVKAAPVWGGEK
jgi:hypothetical protein